MPNGGLDNCYECEFNRFRGNKNKGYCSIRDINITKPCYAYCQNAKSHTTIPQGPVLSQGLPTQEQLYSRIPWHNNIEPRICKNGTCSVCDKSFKYGIEINSDQYKKQFCSNNHYLTYLKNSPD